MCVGKYESVTRDMLQITCRVVWCLIGTIMQAISELERANVCLSCQPVSPWLREQTQLSHSKRKPDHLTNQLQHV